MRVQILPLPPKENMSEELSTDEVMLAIVDKSEEEAKKLVVDNGYRARVASKSGQGFMLTMGFRTDRINLRIEDDKVTGSYIG